MRWTERARVRLAALLRRSDVRAVLLLAALIHVAVAVESALLFAFVAEEGIEEADRRIAEAVRSVRARSGDGDPAGRIAADLHAASGGSGLALRLENGDGGSDQVFGEWPPEAELARQGIPAGGKFGLLRALAVSPRQYLVQSVDLPSGQRLQLLLSLRHAVRETGEIGRGLALLWLASSAAALGAATLAVGWAFRPLRRSTALLSGSPSELLVRRLASGGSGDPVDLHSEAVNRTLDSLAEAFSRLRGFGRDIAHELRTPLNRIQNVAEVALLSQDPDELAKALESVRDSAAELARVVRTLLLLAEVEERRLASRPESIDGDAWLSRFRELYVPLFEDNGKSFAAAGHLGRLHLDATLLDRVLINLLENALTHSAADARVELSAERAADELRIHVDDSGPGIDPAWREAIFERGVTLAPGSQPRRLGLGLPLARAIARLLGGELAAGDSPLGGTRFSLRLPLQA